MPSHQQSVSHRGVRESVSATSDVAGMFDDALAYAESGDASPAIAATLCVDETLESLSAFQTGMVSGIFRGSNDYIRSPSNLNFHDRPSKMDQDEDVEALELYGPP